MNFMSAWNDPELLKLFQNDTPLIDVRAPVEYAEGSIPNSVNLPIMNDEERRLVGICYKEKGQAAAIELGHSLVSGEIKQDRINAWKTFIEQNPATEVFCFRGGLRSQISCQWIAEAGIQKKPIPGGYKRIRNFFLSWLNEAPLPQIVRIGGLTGSGKTTLLKKINNHIDLEELAHHRGSAFGPRGTQPAQVTFENKLSLELLKKHQNKIVLEDESIMLGKITVPQRFFQAYRASPLIILEISPEERILNLFEDYVKDSTPEFFLKGLERIQKKLGAKKASALAEEITLAFSHPPELSRHQGWIKTLMLEYYDPLYQKDLRFNQEKVIFRGNAQEILAFLGLS